MSRSTSLAATHDLGIIALEPIMRVEVTTPEVCVGDVIGDLNSRRWQIEGSTAQGPTTIVRALVPLERMFGLRDRSAVKDPGRATASLELAHYGQLPAGIAAEIVTKCLARTRGRG